MFVGYFQVFHPTHPVDSVLVSLSSLIIGTKYRRQSIKYLVDFMEYVLSVERSMVLLLKISVYFTKNRIRTILRVSKMVRLEWIKTTRCLEGSVCFWRPSYFHSLMFLSSLILWMPLCQAHSFMVWLWYEAQRKELGVPKGRYWLHWSDYHCFFCAT